MEKGNQKWHFKTLSYLRLPGEERGRYRTAFVGTIWYNDGVEPRDEFQAWTQRVQDVDGLVHGQAVIMSTIQVALPKLQWSQHQL